MTAGRPSRGRILLVRHADAGERALWQGVDRARPLTEAGREQAEQLAARLAGHHVDRLVSSGYVRCVETFVPLGERCGLAAAPVPWLEEGADPAVALAALLAGGWDAAGGGDGARHAEASERGQARSAGAAAGRDARFRVAACTHGDVVSGILIELADRGVALGSSPRMQKGSTWVLEVQDGRVTSARYLPPPA